MADFIKLELEALGVAVQFVPLGKHLLDGQEIDLPPAILASIGNDPKKKTVGLYAHYDVQPVSSAFYGSGVPLTLSPDDLYMDGAFSQ